ncbi:hypothetical protein KVT40_004184 [Elsinoe batatas]|uniref:BTB domain-containing protein n=1 Tax=Elsinoe batatas TaxID=2601811 RepID=A0A8K0L5Y9_9PEZI|nr:hypothetical protein KVT40_004184 [Elsinoe batatas]
MDRSDSNDFTRNFDNSILPTVTIVGRERTFKAHKAALADNAGMFCNVGDSRINSSAFPDDVTEALLLFFYSRADIETIVHDQTDAWVCELYRSAAGCMADKMSTALLEHLVHRFHTGKWLATDFSTLLTCFRVVDVDILRPHYGGMAQFVIQREHLPIKNMEEFDDLIEAHPRFAVAILRAERQEKEARARYNALECSECHFVASRGDHRKCWALDVPPKICPACQEKNKLQTW